MPRGHKDIRDRTQNLKAGDQTPSTLSCRPSLFPELLYNQTVQVVVSSASQRCTAEECSVAFSWGETGQMVGPPLSAHPLKPERLSGRMNQRRTPPLSIYTAGEPSRWFIFLHNESGSTFKKSGSGTQQNPLGGQTSPRHKTKPGGKRRNASTY